MELGKNSVLVILVVAFLIVGAIVYVNSPRLSRVQTVTVQGNADVKAQPELVSVYVSVQTLNNSAQDSKDTNAEISNNVMNALLNLGINKSDIQTQDFNVYQDYQYTPSGQKSDGWRTTNTLVVKTSAFDKTGGIVDAAVNNGALVQSINFELTKDTENKLKAQVLGEAAADAKTKAQALADGSGGKLGKLVSIESNDFNYRPWPIYAADASGNSGAQAKSAATNIQPQQLDITADVQAVYEIR